MALPIEPQSRCPRCNHVLDVVEDPKRPGNRPAIGDVVVCIRCAGLLALTSVSGGLRELTDSEHRQLTLAQVLQIADMQHAIASGQFRR